ncbi:MAG: metallophosphoesterase [Butyrivibrio sp.]|nr:metallophosphoesterase [Butyrivibrio sp.]
MIYALSDIHGCFDELKEKMKDVDLSGDNRIIFLGDYIDYGTKSGDVLRFIHDYQKENGEDKVIVLKGNHEAAMLEWIDEFKNPSSYDGYMSYNSWFREDAEQNYKTFKTLINKEQLEHILEIENEASFERLNAEAVKMVLQTSGVIIKWIRSMKSFYETDKQIFVHAGIDEDAEEYWKTGTPEEDFYYKYPATTGAFYKTIIAGHVGTASFAGDRSFHDVFYDGKSHYYIDGSVYKKGGKLLLIGYDEKNGKYYQIERNKKILIKH